MKKRVSPGARRAYHFDSCCAASAGWKLHSVDVTESSWQLALAPFGGGDLCVLGTCGWSPRAMWHTCVKWFASATRPAGFGSPSLLRSVWPDWPRILPSYPPWQRRRRRPCFSASFKGPFSTCRNKQNPVRPVNDGLVKWLTTGDCTTPRVTLHCYVPCRASPTKAKTPRDDKARRDQSCIAKPDSRYDSQRDRIITHRIEHRAQELRSPIAVPYLEAWPSMHLAGIDA